MDIMEYSGEMRACDNCGLKVTEAIIEVSDQEINLCSDCRKELMKRLIDKF